MLFLIHVGNGQGLCWHEVLLLVKTSGKSLYNYKLKQEYIFEKINS